MRSQIFLLHTGFRDFVSGAKQCQDGHVQNRGLKLTQCKVKRVNIYCRPHDILDVDKYCYENSTPQNI
jgi:hypothetical protein